MRMKKCGLLLFVLLAATTLVACQKAAAPTITSPKAELGFELGDDYQLANYTQVSNYWRKLAQESDRMKLVEYGKTSEGRPMLMAIITSPENHAKLDRYKEISKRLSLAQGLTDDEARALAAEGKAVVWIDSGLHATEIANSQTLPEMVYQMVSRNDPETLRFLNDTIFLAAFSNPDGMELVANWYMREKDPLKRTFSDLPVLYQKYIGHDNNRESLLCNMPESTSLAKVLYNEWYPQIMYNQHQTGPAGAILFLGAMRDPTNPNLDNLMHSSMELVSASVHSRFITEGKPGAVSRSMASYQNWYDGGVRNTAGFHNQVAILSEISGNPTPIDIAFIPGNLVHTNDNPFPVQPQQKWHFRQTIEYLLTADRGFLDVASRHREQFLYNIYKMGKNSIEKGSRDNWTISARKTAAVEAVMAKDKVEASSRGGYPIKYYETLHDPAARDARGYIIPSDQPDFLTATKFVNAFIKNGVTVNRATQAFQVGGKSYPAGSYVVKTAQAFRPHVVDCFEPQDYPDDFKYPGGPPIRPYDVTGYTLAFEMGFKFDRILEAFDGPFETITGLVKPAAGTVSGTAGAGYLLSHQVNDSFIAINQLVGTGEDVYWLKSPVTAGQKTYPAGAIYIASKDTTAAKVQKLAQDVGLTFDAVATKPTGDALHLKPVRIGVVDVYGGSMPSGWVQWMFGQYGFPYEVIYPPTLDAGNLRQKYDVLIVENGVVPGAGRMAERNAAQVDPQSIPEEFRGRLGAITEAKTIPQLKQFLTDGGTILAVGSSSAVAEMLGVPVTSALVDKSGKALSPEQFFVQGAVLQADVDTSHPLAYGLPDKVDLVYDNNPIFRLKGGAGVQKVAWFGSDKPLRSGWAWGQEYLKDGVAVADATVGKGKLLMFGPLIVFRAHPHGSFKFLFNGVYYGSAEAVKF